MCWASQHPASTYRIVPMQVHGCSIVQRRWNHKSRLLQLLAAQLMCEALLSKKENCHSPGARSDLLQFATPAACGQGLADRRWLFLVASGKPLWLDVTGCQGSSYFVDALVAKWRKPELMLRLNCQLRSVLRWKKSFRIHSSVEFNILRARTRANMDGAVWQHLAGG